MTTCTENRTDLRRLSLKDTAATLMTAAVLLPEAGEDLVLDGFLRQLDYIARSIETRLGWHAAGLMESHPQLFEGVS